MTSRKLTSEQQLRLVAELDANSPKPIAQMSTSATPSIAAAVNSTSSSSSSSSSVKSPAHKNKAKTKKGGRASRRQQQQQQQQSTDLLDDDWFIPTEAHRRSLHEPYAPVVPIKVSAAELANLRSQTSRLWRANRALRSNGEEPVIALEDAEAPSTDDGVPLGGLGCGTIGRGWRGDFNRWSVLDLAGEEPKHSVVPANQFSIFVAREAEGHLPVARVLHPGPRPLGATALGAWDWGLGRARAGAYATSAQTAVPDRHFYYALYPRAWTTIETALGIEGLHLTCKQLSPVIADNYRDSSAPACVFVWRVVNESPEDRDVSIMLTFKNGDGSASDVAGGHANESYRATVSDDGVLEDEDGDAGVLVMRHRRRLAVRDKAGRVTQTDDSVALAIAGHCATHEDSHVTMCTRWRPDDDASARALWRSFEQTGELSGEHRAHGAAATPSAVGEAIGGAVAVKVSIGAGETAEFVFVLGWHAPLARFRNGDAYWRRYTRFYGRDAVGIKRVVGAALLNWRAWQAAIVEWQRPIMRALRERERFVASMFNELHWLNNGGSLWIDSDAPVLENDADVLSNAAADAEPLAHTDVPRQLIEMLPRAPLVPSPSDDGAALPPSVTGAAVDVVRSEQMAQMPVPAPGVRIVELRADDVGHFLLLSSALEKTFNAVEAQFFGSSWAMVVVFPLLELSMQRDAALALFLHDRTPATIVDTGKAEQRKLAGHIAHDLGAPSQTPWGQLNAYNLHDTNRWRDLAAMFVLQAYRDYVHTHDRQFAADVWPAVESCIEQLRDFELTGNVKLEGLLAHAPGLGDSALGLRGVGTGAYINSLWLGALTAAVAMAHVVGISPDDKAVRAWRQTLARGKTSFHSQLWNVAGQHYDFDSANSHPGMCLASQLLGQWYVDASHLEPIVSRDHVSAALKTIFNNNVVPHGAGEHGVSLMATSPASSIASSKTGGMGGGGSAPAPAASSLLRRRVALNAHLPTTIACVSSMRLCGLVDEARITLNGLLRTLGRLGLQFALPTELAIDNRVRGRDGMLGLWSVYWADVHGPRRTIDDLIAPLVGAAGKVRPPISVASEAVGAAVLAAMAAKQPDAVESSTAAATAAAAAADSSDEG
jgi:non-lysosomal glucosylceramidase